MHIPTFKIPVWFGAGFQRRRFGVAADNKELLTSFVPTQSYFVVVTIGRSARKQLDLSGHKGIRLAGIKNDLMGMWCHTSSGTGWYLELDGSPGLLCGGWAALQRLSEHVPGIR